MDAGILKKVRRVDHLRHIRKAHHIVAELRASRRQRIGRLSLWNTAAKIDIGLAVIIHQYRRIKKPLHISTVFHIPADQAVPQFVAERSHRTVGAYHANAAAVIRKIEEEFRLPVDLLPGCCRRPGIVGPFRHAAFSRDHDLAVVRKVDHILRGDHIKAADLSVGILVDLPVFFIFIGVCRHIKIRAPSVHQCKGIRAVMLLDDGVAVLHTLIALFDPDVLKTLCVIHHIPPFISRIPPAGCRIRKALLPRS